MTDAPLDQARPGAPAAGRAVRRLRLARRPRLRLSPGASIRRRIVFINGLGLVLLLGGVLYLNQFRQGLIDLRAEALRTQGEIIAIAVAEAAGQPDSLSFDPVRGALVLRRLAQPSAARARLYDRGGRLVGDTRSFTAEAGPVETRPLPPPGGLEMRGGPLDWLVSLYGEYVGLFRRDPPLYAETPMAGVSSDPEVYAALEGRPARALRANSEGELIVSVAVPIQRFKAVFGALVLSTEGGAIDAVVRAERAAILQVFLVALIVSAGLSLMLASTIARPLRRLAAAAGRGSGRDGRRALENQRVEFPDYTDREDEIGDLSGALRAMTAALYGRLEAIERFAADVAHEIKNPLTSLRSAVETMRRATKPEHRERLLEVIVHDVGRMDRLVTDISNASRLDAELSRAEMAPVDIRRLIDAVVDVSGGRAEAAGVSLSVSVEPGLETTGLEGQLGQVFRNLVENAISFSPEGGVVRIAARSSAEGGVIATVEDDGPGVPEDKREAVFDRFWSERPEAAFGDHSGLGLSISKQIVAAHGGRIFCENRRGRPGGPVLGARFTVSLP